MSTVHSLHRIEASFVLDKNFVIEYKNKPSSFGFNGLGELVYKRTYSRLQKDGTKENWVDTIERVVNGTFRLQERWMKKLHLPWSVTKAQRSAQEMFDRMFNMKFLPPGRGLWAMGSEITEEKGLYAALNNCAFTSTENIDLEAGTPFCFLMDASMLGIGVGFDTKGANKIIINEPDKLKHWTFTIPDSREGWVESLRHKLESYFIEGMGEVDFDFSKIRPAGSPVKGFGGIASGPDPLIKMHNRLDNILSKSIGERITVSDIVDIMNIIGACVVSGDIRRSAEIAFGDYSSDEFINLKNYSKNEYRVDWGWASNNSLFADLGSDYSFISSRISDNGEPGLAWLDNMRSYGRMCDPKNYRDRKVKGGNPCFHPDTRIATEFGLIRIEDLFNDVQNNKFKTVMSIDGIDFNDATVFPSGWKNVIEVHTMHGRVLKVTPDHRILTENGWEHACEIENGTKLILQAGEGLYGNECSEIDDRLMQIAGWILGDGWLYGGEEIAIYRSHMIFGKDDDKADDIIKSYLKNLDISYTSYYHEGGVGEVPETITISNKEIFKLFNDIACVPSCGAINKRIKDKIFKATKKAQLNLIIGLISSDGTFNIRPGKSIDMRIKSSSLGMLQDIQQILLNMGVISKIYKNRNKNQIGKVAFTYKNKDGIIKEYCVRGASNDLVINGESLRIIKKLIIDNGGLLVGHKQKSLESIPEKWDNYGYNRFIDKVVDVVDNGEEVVVYDISEPKTNSLVANGIVAHNCLEQSLEHMELCCLVETFPNRHDSLEDYKRTLKFAYLYAKAVTLGNTHWTQTNKVMLRNRRIGCSMSGIAQFISKRGLDEFKNWCEDGYKTIQDYDKCYSDWMCIPQSIKTTSIKPSGTVSLLAGATPGIHYPESRFYIRRVRISKNSDLLQPLRNAGYKIEPAVESPKTTVVVEFPVDCGAGVRSVKNVSMWEQLSLAAFVQKHWADNQVSATIKFNPEIEGHQIEHALNYFQYQLKGISFLPSNNGSYKQAPYEEINEEKYYEICSRLKTIDTSDITSDAVAEKYCDGDTCALPNVVKDEMVEA